MGISTTNEQAASPLGNFSATTNPTVNDDANDGYSLGSQWLNTVTGGMFVCTSAAVGAAVWKRTISPAVRLFNFQTFR